MTGLDRFIQRLRIRQASRFIPPNARVLDIGCADGALFRTFKWLREGVGIDPDLQNTVLLNNAKLIPGYFPAGLGIELQFDLITMLAVLEHVPNSEQAQLANDCFRYLRPGGRLVITVPSPFVDRILDVLESVRLIDGMKTEQHYGFDAELTPGVFQAAGFLLTHSAKFEFGLNHLFVFTRPAS